jgi:TetR/AcrR family transcriptional repressor of nem operon
MGNREKVLEAAAGVFGKAGYQSTSIDQILEIAGVAPSNFYYHFKSKEELALEVLEGFFERFRQMIAPILINRSLSPVEKLERFHAYFVQRTTQNGCCGGCPLGNLAQELSDVHPEFRKRLARFFEEAVDGIAQVVRDGVDAGVFRRETDPQAAAYLLFGSIEGLLLLTKSLKRVDPLDQGFRMALDLLRNK